jgi:cysteine desulfurase
VIIDLDHNATTRPEPAVLAALADAAERLYHNPSSVHRAGQDARHAIELARAAVARLIGADRSLSGPRSAPKSIVFTASGTEAIHLAIRGVLDTLPPNRRHLLTNPVEHAAIRELATHLAESAAAAVTTLPVDGQGLIDLDALQRALTSTPPGILTLQWCNNETGAIQPITQAFALARQHGWITHCDGTQWVGKLPTRVHPDPQAEALAAAHHEASPHCPADLLTFAPHKFHGPKGVGVLYLRPGTPLRPLMPGTQENARRAGTENTPAIVAAGVAADLADRWLADPAPRTAQAALRDELEQQLLARFPSQHAHPARILGPASPQQRIWNTTSIAFTALEAEAILLALSERGLYASAGAACSSGSLEPSPVLLAMGIPAPVAHGAIRLSLGRHTTADDITAAIDLITQVVERVAGPT